MPTCNSRIMKTIISRKFIVSTLLDRYRGFEIFLHKWPARLEKIKDGSMYMTLCFIGLSHNIELKESRNHHLSRQYVLYSYPSRTDLLWSQKQDQLFSLTIVARCDPQCYYTSHRTCVTLLGRKIYLAFFSCRFFQIQFNSHFLVLRKRSYCSIVCN